MPNKRILISGASIAGPALAFWLRRYGFDPTIVERAPAIRPGGYAVDFRGASVRLRLSIKITKSWQACRTDSPAENLRSCVAIWQESSTRLHGKIWNIS